MGVSTIAARWRRNVTLHIVNDEGATPQSESPHVLISPAELDPARQAEARRYARQRRRLSLVNLAISAVLIGVLLLSGLNFWLRDALVPVAGGWEPVAGWQPLLVALYFLALALAVTIIDLPLSYYSGYVLPHRYGLSTQSRAGWTWDLIKGLALSLAFELVAVVFVYWLLTVSPDWWWLWIGVAALFVSVILANLGPVLLLPLFYKLRPLPDGEVRAKTLALAAQARTRVRGVYSMNMSAKTTAANAAVMGLGNTRRIVIGDTLLDRYTPDEIEVVVAHELGHQVHWDIPKLIVVQSVVTLGGFYLASLTLAAVVANVPGYHGLSDPATMPLLAAVLGVFGLLILPLNNGFSRLVESQADGYALDLTGKVDAFKSAMTRMANQNLAELTPPAWVEFFLYDHPSTGRRLAFADGWAARHSA
jgi:Zn-dependent protease with chaperone function